MNKIHMSSEPGFISTLLWHTLFTDNVLKVLNNGLTWNFPCRDSEFSVSENESNGNVPIGRDRDR